MPDPFERPRTPASADMDDGPATDARIRRAASDDAGVLFDIWLRSVQATHGFVTAADISLLSPRVRDYLASTESELYIVSSDGGAIAGFMGLDGNDIESLFLAPEHLRRGLGTRLIAEARSRRPGADLTVEVNEQNTDAVRFYEASGFAVEGRTETDGQGLPFPLLHMRRAAD